MTTVHSDSFDKLQSRILQLIEMYEKQKSAKELLSMQQSEMQEQIRQEQERVKNLEEKYNKLKISKALIASSDDVHDAKLKVNRMVREIDKCIALLNR
jgi:DNA-binding protein H-NS